MRVLITGGAGFIGSHLAEALVKEEHHVTVLDNISTGYHDNLAKIFEHPLFKFYKGDVKVRPELRRAMMDANVVFHLAAAVGVKKIVSEPVKTIDENLAGTEAVLKECQARGRPKLILASTSEVYGLGKPPFKETDPITIGPSTKSRWGYACSKAMDEFMAFAYAREHGQKVTVARLFNTVGPRQVGHYGMVVPTFVSQAVEGRHITVYGTGEQTRCFIHVKDTVKALIDLMYCESAEGEIFNIGSRDEISINTLAELIRTAADSNSLIRHIPYDQAYEAGFEDMERRRPSITKIKQYTGWRPRRHINNVINELVKLKSRLTSI